MWKVVVTEVQDASTFEPFDVPPGAFFVSKERLARTVENLDLPRLIDALDAMQSTQEYARDARPASNQGTLPNRNSLRMTSSLGVPRLGRQWSHPTVGETQFVSKNGP
jgi:hypothetical protein